MRGLSVVSRAMPGVAFGLLVVLAAFVVPAAARAQGDPKKELEPIGLHLLGENDGAAIGDWAIWRYEKGDKAIFIINRKTGLAIYVPWTSNGWINYRTGDGAWFVMFSKRAPETQNRDDLNIAPFLTKKPTHRAETGKFTFQGTVETNGVKSTMTWVVKVTKDYVDFHSDTYDDRFTVRANASEFTHNGRTIAYHAFTGTVAKEDPKVKIAAPNGNTVELPAKSFDVKLIGGKKYLFDLTSKDFDTVLVLQNKDGGQIAFDDDGGEGLNSRMTYTPPADGQFKVFAATLTDAGKFDLRIKDDSAIKVFNVGKGLTMKGKLDAGANKRVVYNVEMFKGKTYVINLSSGAFDSFLIIENGVGKQLASDDDSGGGLDSQITFNVTGTGVFRIVATSLGGNGTGDYVLTVREKQ